jgi:hypothetical protein
MIGGNKMNTKSQHTPEIKKKLDEIHIGYYLDSPPAIVDVNAPRALMQAIGEGWSQGIRWTVSQPLYAAAPELLEALKLLVAIYGDDDTTATDQAKNAVAKAEGK